MPPNPVAGRGWPSHGSAPCCQTMAPAARSRSTLVAAVGWALLVLALALELCLWVDFAGTDRLGSDGPAAGVDRAALHRGIIATMRNGTAPPAALTAAERQHLVDVHHLVVAGRWLGLVALITVLATWPRAGRQGLRDGGLALLGAGAGLVVVAADWPVFFRSMHPLLFGDGTWDFDPGRHLLAGLYSPGYFALRALPAVLPVAGLGLAAWLVGRGDATVGLWRWPQRRDLRWLAAAVPVLALGLAAGRRLDVPWTWAHLVWTALVAAAVIGGAAAVRGRGARAGVVGLGLAAAGVVGIAGGLRWTDLQARAATSAAGAAIAVIDDHRARGARFADLAALPANARQLLPTPPSGFGPWYYIPIRDGYLLGFRGPLAWHYEYHSRRGSWNLPRYGP